jgi:hypothetical protein
LQEQLGDRERQYINSSPWKIGDKVRVCQINNRTGVETWQGPLFISKIEVWISDEYRYYFNKPKKDGTMGGSKSGVLAYDKMVRHE